MKTCLKCGRVTDDDANFCDFCGGSEFTAEKTYVVNDCNVSDESSKLVASLAQNLRRERKTFKIFGIIFLAFSALVFFILSVAVVVFFVSEGGSDHTSGSLGLLAAMLAYCGSYLTVFLPIGIINLVAAGKIDYYLNTIDNDIRPARNRITSVGIIVFDALFNNIALIFCIINFVNAKRHAAVLDAIEAKQSAQR